MNRFGLDSCRFSRLSRSDGAGNEQKRKKMGVENDGLPVENRPAAVMAPRFPPTDPPVPRTRRPGIIARVPVYPTRLSPVPSAPALAPRSPAPEPPYPGPPRPGTPVLLSPVIRAPVPGARASALGSLSPGLPGAPVSGTVGLRWRASGLGTRRSPQPGGLDLSNPGNCISIGFHQLELEAGGNSRRHGSFVIVIHRIDRDTNGFDLLSNLFGIFLRAGWSGYVTNNKPNRN